MFHPSVEALVTTVFKGRLAGLCQNGFTGEAKAGETKKNLASPSTSLYNNFTLQYLDLRKTGEAETKISYAKQTLSCCKLCSPNVKHIVGISRNLASTPPQVHNLTPWSKVQPSTSELEHIRARLISLSIRQVHVT